MSALTPSKKREKYEEFLKNVKILSNMDNYERMKLCDAFKELRFKPGEYVIREGEDGSVFFIIQEGEAVATKTLTPGQGPETVMNYSMGDYFGERALLKNEPRAANVLAKVKRRINSDRSPGSVLGQAQL